MVNLEIFKELLLDYEDGNLSFSDKVEFRDKLRDLLDDIERKIDGDYVD